MSLVFDEYGRPFIIMREQGREDRVKGLDAQKANIQVRPAHGPRARACTRATPPPPSHADRSRARARARVPADTRRPSRCAT